MKQLYFLLYLLLFANTVFSQQKFEFGFVVKAGNATLPTTQVKQQLVKSGWRPGFSSQYGMYGKRRIGEHIFLSAEVLYQFAQATKWDKVHILPDGADFPELVKAGATTKVWENNLIIPLNLHFSPSKWEKTSFNLGIAVAFHLRSEVSFHFQGYPETETGSSSPTHLCDCLFAPVYAVQEISVYRPPQLKQNAQVLLGGGLQRRLSEYTSVGAELLVSLRGNPSGCSLFLGEDCCLPVLGYTVASRYPIAMRSLSISLYHNILR